MKIKWNQTFEVELIDQFYEATDIIGKIHNETFTIDTFYDVDIIDRDGEPDYVDIQFGNGSLISSLPRSSFTAVFSTNKKCESMCPNCGVSSDRIEWGVIDIDIFPYQEGICEACGCTFREVHKYSYTEFNLHEVDRVKCPYPMSKFYTYMDEVPQGDRVSTTDDCKKCDEKGCNLNYCLISAKRDNNPHRRQLWS